MQSWLPYAIESCLWQTETRLEVLVINDGSTDATLAIASAYAKADSRVRVHDQANMGAGRTRQVGQALSRGRYLMWLDADDFLDRRAAADMLAVADRDKVDMVCGNAVVFSDKTFNTRRYFYHPAVARTTFENPRYWKSKVLWRWIVNTRFANASNASHPDLKLGQDVVVMYDLLSQVGHFSQCPSFMYYFRQEHKGIDSSLETEIEHQLAHYVNAKDILVSAGNIKPLIKYLSENYLRDIKNIMPRIQGGREHWGERVEQLSLDIFRGLSPEWFTPAFAAPEVRVHEDLLPLAQALIAADLEGARREFVRWSHLVPRSVDKTSPWHTFRRNVKAMFSPLSLKARRRQADLAKLARRRLGTLMPR